MEPEQGGNYWQGDEQAANNAAAAPEQISADESYDALEPVSWEASEYIDHQRDGVWFIGFTVVTLLLVLLSVFLIKNYIFTALIVVMAVAVLLYTKRPPQVLRYTLSQDGLTVGERYHSFGEFRAFGIIQDGGLLAVKLLPTARFGQELTVYFSENDGETIVDIFSEFLPMEQLRLDIVDRLLRRLRL